uniref:C1q domain-containing protein n=1 Tax=Lates calcarifer TaxID=8187 RepID=A0A4W6FPP3_LATCA
MLHHFVLVIGALLSLATPMLVAMETCPAAGIPGIPGMPGLPGRDGRTGEKGEKGEAGAEWQGSLSPQRGEKRGTRGTRHPRACWTTRRTRRARGLLESRRKQPSAWPEEPTSTRRKPASSGSPQSSPTSTMTTTLAQDTSGVGSQEHTTLCSTPL